eukprot:UN14233
MNAMLVEPIPKLFNNLQSSYSSDHRIQCLNAVVSNRKGKVPFYYVNEQLQIDNPESPHWQQNQLGSFNRDHLVKHSVPEEYISELVLDAKTGGDILQSLTVFDHIDLIIIDAEGFDDIIVYTT